jgi:hypothetical protein
VLVTQTEPFASYRLFPDAEEVAWRDVPVRSVVFKDVRTSGGTTVTGGSGCTTLSLA